MVWNCFCSSYTDSGYKHCANLYVKHKFLLGLKTIWSMSFNEDRRNISLFNEKIKFSFKRDENVHALNSRSYIYIIIIEFSVKIYFF